MHNKVIDRIKELGESVLSGTDFFLIDVEVKGSREPVVWIYIDALKEGVNMDQCAKISNELGVLIDAHNLFNGTYRLNVSSPGLSRPLSDRRQYPKNRGRKARIRYKDSGEYLKVEGTLLEVAGENVVVESEDNKRITIPFESIVETKIIPKI